MTSISGAACVSTADVPRLPADVIERIHAAPAPHFKAHLECDPLQTESLACGRSLRQLRELLAASSWFDTLEADPESATILITVQPPEREPYQYSPSHNPGMLLLALALPIPWNRCLGYRFTATVAGTGATARVDTRREATAISWSLAPLLNLLPDRSFAGDSERELAQVQAQLLPLVGRAGSVAADGTSSTHTK
jgi:hypothetical protein